MLSRKFVFKIYYRSSQHNRIDVRNKTFLILAHSGQTHEVYKYILSGQDINITNEQGETALHIASANGYIDMVEVLMKEYADPNLRTANVFLYFIFIGLYTITFSNYM